MHALCDSGQSTKGLDELLERLRRPPGRWNGGWLPPRLPEREPDPEDERPEIVWDEV